MCYKPDEIAKYPVPGRGSIVQRLAIMRCMSEWYCSRENNILGHPSTVDFIRIDGESAADGMHRVIRLCQQHGFQDKECHGHGQFQCIRADLPVEKAKLNTTAED